MDHKGKNEESMKKMLCYPMMCPLIEKYKIDSNEMIIEENNMMEEPEEEYENESNLVMPEYNSSSNMRYFSDTDEFESLEYDEIFYEQYNDLNDDDFRQINRVDFILRRIEDENPDIFRLLASYGINRSEGRRIIRRIIRLVLQAER